MSKKLSLQHHKFVLEYLKDFNATQAAIRARYSKRTANEQGARLLAKASIQEAVKEASDKLFARDVATAEELREFWTSVMRGDIGEICSWGDQGLSFNSSSDNMPKEKRRLIKKITVVEKVSPKGDFTETRTSVELHDPLKASELLGKAHGMFIEKHELTGKGGKPIKLNMSLEFIKGKR